MAGNAIPPSRECPGGLVQMSVNILNRVLPRGPMQGPMVWTRPKSSGPNIVVLTSTELVVGKQWPWKVQETANALASGKSIADLLGKDAVYIPLFSVTALEAIVGNAELKITFERGAGKKASHFAPFTSKDMRDEALTAIKDRLGQHVETDIQRRSRLGGAAVPLVAALALFLAAATFYHLASSVFGITPTSPSSNPAALQAWHIDPWQRLADTSPLASLGFVGVFAGALTATLLGIFGYMIAGALLLTGATYSLCLAVNRLLAPATTITVRALAAT